MLNRLIVVAVLAAAVMVPVAAGAQAPAANTAPLAPSARVVADIASTARTARATGAISNLRARRDRADATVCLLRFMFSPEKQDERVVHAIAKATAPGPALGEVRETR
jgi:hypothetical protein